MDTKYLFGLIVGLFCSMSYIAFDKIYYEKEKKIEYIYIDKEVILKDPIEISEYKKYMLAIAMTESEFDKYAIGKTDDYGIFQITPIFVKEINRCLGENIYTHEDAFNINKSIEMYDIMYSDKHLNEIIKLHNPNAGKWYSDKVYKNIIKVNTICEIIEY